VVNGVEGEHVRIADAEGAYPLNVALPGTSSTIICDDTAITCLDLQARNVDIEDHKGALVIAATTVTVKDVDSTSGNAQLGVIDLFSDFVNPQSVVVAAEYDSPDSEVLITNVQTSDLSVLYYNTIFNDRLGDDDKITIEQVKTDSLSIGTGFGTDGLVMQNVQSSEELLIDLGSDSTRRNPDGANFAMLFNVNCGSDCTILGGSSDDEIICYYSEIADAFDVELGSGNDTFKSYRSFLGDLTVSGGQGTDEAFEWQSSWNSFGMDMIEYDNF
jgi:hypothetical protein